MTLYDAHTHIHPPQSVAVVRGAGERIIPSHGVHPWFIKERAPDWKERLEALLANGGAGVGEIGLDRARDAENFEEQKEVFTWQLDLAARRNLPVTIHCVKAWGALWDILREHPLPECGFLLHAYGGPAEMVGGFLRRGAYFSFAGRDRKDIFRTLPPERLLIETDNHPERLQAHYEEAARLRGWTMEQLAAQIEENFQRLFGGIAG